MYRQVGFVMINISVVVGRKEKLDILFFFFKQKTAYEIVSRDWSSDVCSSDLPKSVVKQPYLYMYPVSSEFCRF